MSVSRSTVFVVFAKKDSILLQFAGILRGRKKISGNVATCNRQHFPPVWQGLACRSITCIVPHYRLKIILASNSGTRSKGVGLCLPQRYPNRNVCRKQPVHDHTLMFLSGNPCYLMTLSLSIVL